MTQFNETTTSLQAATALANDIKGKNVLITGASPGGLGAQTAHFIAPYANLIVLSGRSQSKLDESVQSILAQYPAANVRTLIMDLTDLVSVRKAAAEINTYSEMINVLINMAGVMAVPYSLTADGFETHMAANHFGHFLFTSLIFPSLVSAGSSSSTPSRIVSVSSRGHARYPVNLDDLEFSGGKTYSPFSGYAQSKAANVLFANEIARRCKESGTNVIAFSCHPAAVDGTNLGSHITLEQLQKIGMKNEKGEWTVSMTPIECGCATTIVSAFDPSIIPESGGYLYDAVIANDKRADHASSVENGKRLWEISEQRVGQKFEI